MLYHMCAMITGYILDLIIGDPYQLPHPIRAIGKLISILEKGLIGAKDEARGYTPDKLKKRGIVLVICVVLVTLLISSIILLGAYIINPYLGIAVESIMTYQILATKCLKVESMKVYKALNTGDIEASRKAVSMIVGRDTQCLDATGVAKAAIETVAENTSDGVIAPMIYTAIGGPILGFVYKAVNTMDSMVGYKNDRYIYFGRAAAKLDDIVNYIPSRISAYLMMFSCFIGNIPFHIKKKCTISGGSKFDAKNAYIIYKRDRYNHASPNSAQTEAVCAGALGIRLAGNASYFGNLVEKPYIGDSKRDVETEDIKRANSLLYITSFLCEICCIFIMASIRFIVI